MTFEKEEIRKLLNIVDEVLSKNQEDIAAVIFEPLIQGAGGMKVCRKEFFDSMLKKFRDAGVIIIFDEVMTGFGRTGKMFAADYLKNKPDIMCLAKSMTGGYIPLAATIFSEKIHREFLGGDIKKLFTWTFFFGKSDCLFSCIEHQLIYLTKMIH